MIAYIKGTLEQVLENAAVVETGGLGYLVKITAATTGRLPQRGQEVKLFTSMQVREDDVSLYGFLSQEEVKLFGLLISVSGIGPKVASSILSTLTPSQLVIAIVSDDAVALSKAPGVGRKTAQRITLELRDKIKTPDGFGDEDFAKQPIASFAASDEKRDALDAMLALGYGRAESLKAVLETAKDGMTAEAIIKQALRVLHRGGNV